MWGLDEIGDNIALLRKARGLTQEQVAFQSNLSVSRFQDIEHGCYHTTMDTLICISRTLGVDSRLLGTFLKPEQELLAVARRTPRMPERKGGPLQICDNIVLLRKKKGLTQAQLASMAHISIACLRDVEHGCANVTVDTLINIAQAFDMSLLELTAITLTDEELLRLAREARDVVNGVLV